MDKINWLYIYELIGIFILITQNPFISLRCDIMNPNIQRCKKFFHSLIENFNNCLILRIPSKSLSLRYIHQSRFWLAYRELFTLHWKNTTMWKKKKINKVLSGSSVIQCIILLCNENQWKQLEVPKIWFSGKREFWNSHCHMQI